MNAFDVVYTHLNADLDKAISTPSNLTLAISELTGLPTDSATLQELGPGTLYLLELPRRTLRYLSRSCHELPNSFFSLAESVETWDELVSEKDIAAYSNSWQDLEDTSVFSFQVKVSRRGATKAVRDYRKLLRDADGKIVGVVGKLLEDSFREMAMESLMRRSWKEIATQMTRRFLHDFNNTIAGIYSLSELYAEPGSKQSSMIEAMEHIRNSSIRAQEITKKIRYLTTLESGEPSYFNLEQLIEEQTEYLQALLPKGARIDYSLTKKEIPVHLDAHRFHQAILHLASNAFDAAGNDIAVSISLELESDLEGKEFARLEFSDNGPGIPDSIFESVTQPFFSTKNSDKHPGLGLNVVKAFIENLGGRMEIHNLEPNGCSTHLHIPIVMANTAIEKSPKTSPSARKLVKSPPETSSRPKEILVYTWEDITRHPLLLAMREAGWKFRIHLDPGQLLIDLSQRPREHRAVLVFKSSLDEKVEPLISELGHVRDKPKVAVIALGESVDSVSEVVKRSCELIESGTSKPKSLLKKLAAFYS